MAPRDLDVVVFGATGFVGALTAEHLAARAPAGARIGLAGRNEAKLRMVRAGLSEVARDWPIIVADSNRPETLRAMAERATVVATTVGPYTDYGMPLVAACAAAGTHYADLTGEVLFVRKAIDDHHDEAVASGARIVTGAGFDAVPSDLGVLELHRAAEAQQVGTLGETVMLVTDLRGGVSGGTFASIAIQVTEMRRSAEARRLIADPYALSPDRGQEPDRARPEWGRERDVTSISRDPVTGRWRAPFVMASYNTRVVRRSNALQRSAYGPDFRYQEFMALAGGAMGLAGAAGVTSVTAALAGGLLFSPTRSLISARMPSPGEGPSAEARAKGRFRCEFWSRTTTGVLLTGEVSAKGDPGYAATAVMFGEAALALAFDTDQLPEAAGVLTPAAGIGAALTTRLRLNDFTISAAVR
jgi:short subunit dehydrogenase-like uncharacterized protein